MKILRTRESPPEIGDIVIFKQIGRRQSTLWMITSFDESNGRFYGRGFAIAFPEPYGASPEELEVIVPGDQLKALLDNPNASYNELNDIVRK